MLQRARKHLQTDIANISVVALYFNLFESKAYHDLREVKSKVCRLIFPHPRSGTKYI